MLFSTLQSPTSRSARLRALVCLGWVASMPAWASSFYERPFPEAVRDAPVIVRGKIGTQYADWVVAPDGGRRIFTFSEVLVDEVLKGQARMSGNSLVLRELGGQKDGVGMQVSGSAQFSRGEDVVVLLSGPGADGSHDLLGLMMGKYAIRSGPGGEERLVGAGLDLGVGGTGHAADHGAARPGAARETWTLARVRELIAKQKLSDPNTANPAGVASTAGSRATGGGFANRYDAAGGGAPATTTEAPSSPQAGAPGTRRPAWSVAAAVVVLAVGALIGGIRRRRRSAATRTPTRRR